MENVLESWAEIAITVKTEDIETAGNIANMVVPYGIYIEDYSALEEDAAEISHYDFIDDSLLHKDQKKGMNKMYNHSAAYCIKTEQRELFTFISILMKIRLRLFLL